MAFALRESGSSNATCRWKEAGRSCTLRAATAAAVTPGEMPVAMGTMHTHEAIETRALGPSDLPAIIALERASWATGLQADVRLIEQRFALGSCHLCCVL